MGTRRRSRAASTPLWTRWRATSRPSPYGVETARIGSGGGGGYVLTEQDKADIAALVRQGMTDGDLAEW